MAVPDAFSAISAMRTQATMVDYPGRMAALMFTAGCNFRCGFCHNPDLWGGHAKTYTYAQLDEHCARFRKQWVEAVSITGGEPTIRPELPETVRFFKEKGFQLKLDTNGSNPDVLEALLPSLDYVAMDIKCRLENSPKLTGYGDTSALRRSIRLIMEKARDYEFRTTLIESFHDEADLLAAARDIAGAKRWIFQPFVPHPNLPDPAMRDLPRTRPSALEQAATLVRAFVEHADVR